MHSTSRFTQHHMYYTQKHLRQTKWAQRKGETLRVHFAWGQHSRSTTGASSRNKGKLALLLQEALLLSLSHSFPPTCWHKGGKPTSIKIWQKKKKREGGSLVLTHTSPLIGFTTQNLLPTKGEKTARSRTASWAEVPAYPTLNCFWKSCTREAQGWFSI